MTALFSGENTIVNIKTEKPLNFNELKSDKSVKIFLFYRSLCTPCGEQTFIRELLQLVKENSEWDLSLYLIFRHYDQLAMDSVLQQTFQSKNVFTFYMAGSVSPPTERYFLSGNPYIAAFSTENHFIKALVGDRINPQSLEKFIKGFVDSVR